MNAPAWNSDPGARRSDPEHRQRVARQDAPETCDVCGATLGDYSQTIAGVGRFCALHRDSGRVAQMAESCMVGDGEGRR